MRMTDLFGLDDAHVEATPLGGVWTYVRVAVERGLDQGGRGEGLTYKSATPLEVGRRVEVPLGRGDKKAAGVVIATGGDELLGGFAPRKVKTVLRDTGTGLPASLVELATWMSTYYVCPLGMVLGSMLPAAVKKRTGLRTLVQYERLDAAAEASLLDSLKLTRNARELWERFTQIDAEDLPLTADELITRLGVRTRAPIQRLVKLGLLKESHAEDVRQRGGVETQMGIEQADPFGGIGGGARPTLTPEQARVVEGIGGTLGAFGVHLIRGVTGSGKTEVYLRVLEKVLERGKSAIVLVPEISLTPQTAGRFVERFRSVGVGVLHSGLSASQRHKEWARAASGSARVMVGARSAIFSPLANIGLIVVDEEHAGDYKQDQLPRYHGRDVAIKRAQMEGCAVVLGSATPSLESWANAWAGRGERREGVEAKDGARTEPVRVPATQPSSKYTLWELNDRVAGGKLPRVEVVDLAEERKLRERIGGGFRRDAHLHLVGPTLERAIGETLDAGGQVLLLLNRRGYASYIACPDANCGWFLSCDDCDAKMVQHKVIAGHAPPKGVVRCHHCLAQRLLPERCPVCEKKLITLGMGTQGLEQELTRKFAARLGGVPGDHAAITSAASVPPPSGLPPTPPGLMRVDGDTMGSARDYFAVLSRFSRGEIKILIGTQMIAKGLDFPNVRLVGVINADSALSLPDFRASERTFQLVSQVAGRTGRGSMSGRVIVQTFDPLAPPITFAAVHDYVGFAAQELHSRRESGLPPATRMARLVLRDMDMQKVQGAADKLKAALMASNTARGEKIHFVGPSPCPISRIAGHHRFEILLFSSSRMAIQEVLGDARAQGLCKSDAHTAVDVDPMALM